MSLVDLALIAIAVVWVLARQVRVAQVKPRLLVAAPLVLGYFGLRSVPPESWRSAADVGLLGLSVVASLGLGLWRGRTITVWRDADGTWWRRGSALTLLLWGAVLVVRGALLGLAVAVGHPEASAGGALLCSLAVGFAAQNAVVAVRLATGSARRRTAAAQADCPARG
jgi:hypothetical protein